MDDQIRPLQQRLRDWIVLVRPLLPMCGVPYDELEAMDEDIGIFDNDWEPTRRARVANSDDYAKLRHDERDQADAIAEILRHGSVGAYSGSETDAVTDAVSILYAARFAPPLGDNHHNAALCPYCTPSEPAANEDTPAQLGLHEILMTALQEWHYDHAGMSAGERHPHGSFSDALAFTHCICWGAGSRVAEPLVAEIGKLTEHLAAVLEQIGRVRYDPAVVDAARAFIDVRLRCPGCGKILTFAGRDLECHTCQRLWPREYAIENFAVARG